MNSYLNDINNYLGLYINSYFNMTEKLVKNVIDYNSNVLTLLCGINSHSDKDFCFPHGENIQNEDLTYHYLIYGEEGKRPIIFLHGILLNSTIWHNHCTHFSKENSVYSIDFLGHGCSTKKRDLNMEDLVEELRFFIEAKKLEDPIIVGHSLGGLVAGCFAALYPEKVDKLIILSTVDYDSFNKNIFNKITAFNLNFINKCYLNPFTLPLITQMLESLIFNKIPSSTRYDEIHFMMYHLKIKGMTESLLSLMKSYEIKNFTSDKYRNIKSQTLIIHGNSDRLINYWNGQTLHNNIPNSKLRIINRGAHMIILENRHEINMIIEEFIKESDK